MNQNYEIILICVALIVQCLTNLVYYAIQIWLKKRREVLKVQGSKSRLELSEKLNNRLEQITNISLSNSKSQLESLENQSKSSDILLDPEG